MTDVVLNLSPHPVTILVGDEKLILWPESTSARTVEQSEPAPDLIVQGRPVPTVLAAPAGVSGLPDPVDGVLLLVARPVAQTAAALGRSTADLLVQGDFERDSAGYPIGCRSLVRVAVVPYGQVAASLPQVADEICDRLAEHFPADEARIRQVLALAEEAGEFVGAYRRAAGMARRPGSWADVEAELADVVITGFVTGRTLGIDVEAAIGRKLEVLFNRGWRDPRAETDGSTVDATDNPDHDALYDGARAPEACDIDGSHDEVRPPAVLPPDAAEEYAAQRAAGRDPVESAARAMIPGLRDL